MDSGGGFPDTSRAARRVTSRRSLLKGLTALMAVGAVAPLAAACGQPAAPAKPAETKPAAPAATTAPAAPAAAAPTAAPKTEAKPAESKPTAAAAPAKPAAGEPKKGGTLKWAIIGEPPALDVQFTTATVTANIGWHIWEGLFTVNAAQAPKMDLLEKYEGSTDGKKVTMTLRKGVPFHNDKEMTSADAVASLKRYGEITARGKGIFAVMESIDAPDKYTVTMSFKEPRATILPIFLSRPEALIMPAEIAQKAGKDKATEFIGTGPYKFVEHQPDRHVKIGRFDKYAARDEKADGPSGKKVAYLDEIQFIPVPEESVRADGVGTGEYHYGDSLAPDSYARLKGVPNVEADIGKPYYWAAAFFNKKEGVFSNVKLRQALQWAVSVEPVAAAAFGIPEFYRIDPSMAAPETPWFSDVGKDVWNKPDLEKAKALIKEAGYDGTPIRWLSTKEYFYNYNAAVVYKQQLEAVGFKVDLQVMDWATLIKRRSDPKEYDVFITGTSSYTHPILQNIFGEGWPGWWALPEKNEVAARVMTETDPKKQQELIVKLQELVYQDVPCHKYGEYFGLRARSTKLQGTINPPDPFMWNAWLS
ncbi:MAG: ABC transporter substrate-binding protein [Chloroflexi bacterium]|nr:ABC transporter substrate-binding protein [Chloroflexota bacterium]